MLQINYIRLRALTDGGIYGTDIRFDGKLTIIHAPNTSGKSTVLHAFIYALGLEQMLSPKREIPLSYAMRDYVEDPTTSRRFNITQSYVEVEIENAGGAKITVRRNVISKTDRRLVSVIEGPALTTGSRNFAQNDYYVNDGGAAQRQVGFHYKLAEFLGWRLPSVKRYDGGDCPLYLETLFPLFFVEQKVGWSAIPGAIPTQFRIREVQRRSVEYLMNFDTHDIELRRQNVEMNMNLVRNEWTKIFDAIVAMASLSGLRVIGLPTLPTAFVEDVTQAHLEVFENGEWQRLQSCITSLSYEIEKITRESVPDIESVADEIASEIENITQQINNLNTERNILFRNRQVEKTQYDATQQRLTQIDEDLQKNKDALKLQNFGSKLSRRLNPNHCPTCDQPIDQSLLPQGSIGSVMSLEDNIEFLDAQRKALKRLLIRSDTVIKDISLELIKIAEDVRHLSGRLRTLKSDLVAPSESASSAFIEQRLRLEQRLGQLRDLQGRFDDKIAQLCDQALIWRGYLAEQKNLPPDKLSDADRSKIGLLENSIRSQLSQYGFITFPPKDLTVSEDSYRPEKEGFEIGFELSASDSIRLKWAYQLGLLDVSNKAQTNHPHLVVFDEPRQQEAAETSVAGLLIEAARLSQSGAQIIIATSEKLSNIKSVIEKFPCQICSFSGRMIGPVT